MTNLRTLMLLAASLGAAALAGCGADVPEKPSWQADVYPIVKARCVRCHNAQQTGDPLSPGVLQGNFDHASFDDFASLDQNIFFQLAPTYIESDDPKTQMPPPPAARLADWQIQTIARFVTDNKPSQ